jgi:hypothetical protein
VADIFLSYAREDQETAHLFAEGLEAAGYSVWWDVTLRSGEAYDEVTERALKEAKAVVVLWSKTSVDSRWVRAEAVHGERNKTLAPAMIEPCERPIMFELTQTAELFHWTGDVEDPAWLAFVDDVHKLIAASDREAEAAAGTEEAPPPRPRRLLRSPPMTQAWQWALVAAVAAAAVAFFLGPQLARAPAPAAVAANAPDPHRLAKCNALLEENTSAQARSMAYLGGDMAARQRAVMAEIGAGRSGSEIYYPAIEDTTTAIGDYAYLSHYWEDFSSCVNDGTLSFERIIQDKPFPEAFWNGTRELRHAFGRNWRGQGRILPDFMSNFADLCIKYRADRNRRNPFDDPLNCDL